MADENKGKTQDTGQKTPEEGIELKKLKKPTYAISMFLGVGGVVVALILAFVINDALDKTQTAINSNLDGLHKLLVDVEKSAGTAEDEIDALNGTFNDLNSSVSGLADGIGGTGETVKDFGDALSQISFPGFSLAGQGAQLKDSGDTLISGAEDLKEVGELSEHRQSLADLKSAIGSIRDDIKSQRAQLNQAKESIGEVIGLVKLGNILLLLMFMLMFGMLILNSAAGVL